MTKLTISIFGSTGSVGKTTLNIIRENKEKFDVKILTANNNINDLISLANEFNPDAICFANESDLDQVKKKINSDKIEYYIGEIGLLECAKITSDIVIAGIVGLAGLPPLLESIRNSKKVCIANKECFVSAGSLIVNEAKKHKTQILPLDSEHSAIYQILENTNNTVKDIYLTASGGPFYKFSKDELLKVRVNDAVKNPNWVMGKKISVDSATLMNKGLEIIEAKHLFNMDESKIKVVIHRQSIAHGIVSFEDNSFLAAFGYPDMTHPIKYAIFYPNNYNNKSQKMNIDLLNNLSFETVDEEEYHALKLVRSVIKSDDKEKSIILNSSNEVAVKAFLDNKIRFVDILVVVEESIEYVSKLLGNETINYSDNLDNILYLDCLTRQKTGELIKLRF
tara:strand:- start:348 stop:1529 length:1182 start_codon:yes stop_codon:yes gene_type:complete